MKRVQRERPFLFFTLSSSQKNKIQNPPPIIYSFLLPNSIELIEAFSNVWSLPLESPKLYIIVLIPAPLIKFSAGLTCLGSMMVIVKKDSVCIREVWADNLEEEFELIRDMVDQYPYVAMDTEFPGVVMRPLGRFKSRAEYHYHTLKVNVDNLKLIQLGLTFSDEEGNLPECGTGQPCVWQFNLREFNPNRDIHASDSIELLRQSGIDFKKNNHMGIKSKRFAELLMSSGIVLNENVKWITFHSAYDFGYLIKLLTCNYLPHSQEGFFSLMKLYFPSVYDVKHMMKFCDGLYGGLNKLAELLKVERIGTCHQAGSDSLLTCSVFMKLKEGFPNRSLDKHTNVLYGLGLDNCY